MIRKLPATLCLLSFLLSAPFFAGPEVWGLDTGYKRSLQRQLEFLMAKHPKYVFGGAGDPDKGLDCSGYVYLAAKWAGIPGICRATSLKMSQGLCGWSGVEIGLDSADVCDLAFWSFEPHRPNGHVGVLLRDSDGWPAVTHASSRRGVVLDVLQGKLLRDLTKVRRLTIGD